MEESLRFNSAICSTVKVTGKLGNGMADNALKAGRKASGFRAHLPFDKFGQQNMLCRLTKRECRP
jgi:hypothetical protein